VAGWCPPTTRTEYQTLLAHGFEDAGIPESRRAIIVVRLTRVADSCGYGVPQMAHEGRRSQLPAWSASQLRNGGPAALADYMRRNNLRSIDGLPGVDLPAAAEE